MYLLEVRGSVACLPRCKLVGTEYSEDKSFYWTTKTTSYFGFATFTMASDSDSSDGGASVAASSTGAAVGPTDQAAPAAASNDTLQQQQQGFTVPAFDLKAIPTFDGTADVVQWFEQATRLCALRNVSLVAVLPTRLREQAYEVWASLSLDDQMDAVKVKKQLYGAFGMGPDAAIQALYQRRLQPDESVDAYLGAIKRLVALIGYVSAEILTVMFLQGLPAEVRLTVRNSVGDTPLTLERALVIARTTLANAARERRTTAAAVAAVQPPRPQRRGPVRCWVCDQVGHISRQCPNGRGGGGTSAPLGTSSPATSGPEARRSSPPQ